jgi:hypothetical protein
METFSPQLMDPKCKPVHEHAYKDSRSVGQQYYIVWLVYIGV